MADFPSVCFGSLFLFFDCVPKEVPSFTMRPYIFWWWQTDNPWQVCMLILFLVSLYFTFEGACLYDRKNIIKALSSCHQSLVANYFLPSYMLRFWRPSEQAFLLSRTQRPFTHCSGWSWSTRLSCTISMQWRPYRTVPSILLISIEICIFWVIRLRFSTSKLLALAIKQK